jgi:hypothetical protein
LNDVYNLNKVIIPSVDLVINRSLDSSLFASIVNYKAPEWRTLIEEMNENKILYIS